MSYIRVPIPCRWKIFFDSPIICSVLTFEHHCIHILNSCAEYFSYNTCADFWHVCVKGLETTPWKHIVVKLIWPTGRQGQKMIVNMSICFHWRSTCGKTSTQKKISKNFYCTKSFVLKFQGESLKLFLSYHVHFRRYRHFGPFWHARHAGSCQELA